ncbi:formyltransferase family protein [Mongoliitalea lutea]|uniref:Methionyl-tRNA formyltransferase n=1 Tax=Mongoliitalea lutea TaxID=849756 RepID=A0A8J3CV56_9BACT|nr:formyltransferase family protein [Mongoliitalea lutea]GHB31458.1 hypothetical protein GCM10008106_10290 [Mongoliitalea lutea]
MRIVIAGKNSIAVSASKFILDRGFDAANLFIATNATDFGVDTWQPSLLGFAKENNIRVVKLEEIYEWEDLIFFSLEYDKLIKPSKFSSKKLYNIHFSSLPEYKGMYTSCLPILHGKTYSGVTLHMIDPGIDTGDIIDQINFEIPLNCNAYNLYLLYLNHSFKLFEKNFDKILNNDYTTKIQSSINSTYYSKKDIDFSNVQINFQQSAFQVFNQVRAFSFRPYQLLSVDGKKIAFAKITQIKSSKKSGVLIEQTEFSCRYATIDFDIELYHDVYDEIKSAIDRNDLDYLKHVYELGYDLSEKSSCGLRLIDYVNNATDQTINAFLDKL